MTCVNHALKEAFVDVNRAYDKCVECISHNSETGKSEVIVFN